MTGVAITFSNVLSNDLDSNNGTLSANNISLVAPSGATSVVTSGGNITSFSVPSQGSWSLNTSTGAVTFTPNVGFTSNPTSIKYTVKDSGGVASNAASIILKYATYCFEPGLSGSTIPSNHGITSLNRAGS